MVSDAQKKRAFGRVLEWGSLLSVNYGSMN